MVKWTVPRFIDYQRKNTRIGCRPKHICEKTRGDAACFLVFG